jgi:hypothetical protein
LTSKQLGNRLQTYDGNRVPPTDENTENVNRIINLSPSFTTLLDTKS